MNFLSKLFTPSKTQEDIHTDATTAKCPYCEYDIKPLPAQKKKCPSCSKTIIVRTHYKTKNKVLLTDLDVVKFDQEKEKYYLVTAFLRGLEQAGISRNTIDSLIDKQQKILKDKFNTDPLFSDVAWAVSNQLIIKYPELARSIHFQQALFLHKEGKDPTKIRILGFKEDLMEYKKGNIVTKVEVVTAGEQSCVGCSKLANKFFTIDEALEKEILPCKECTFEANEKGIGWCRCCYAPHIDF